MLSTGYQSDGIVVDEEGDHSQPRHSFRVGVGHEESTPLVGGANRKSFLKQAGDHSSGLLYAIRAKRDAIVEKIKPHMKKIKIGILFVVLLFGIVAFATTAEPEVDNTFALSSNYGLIIPLNEDYPKGFVQLHATSIQPTSHYPIVPAGFILDDMDLIVTLQLQQQVNQVWNLIESSTLVIREGHHDTNHSLLTSGGGGEGGPTGPSLVVVWELPSDNPDFRLNITTNSDEPVPLGLEIRQHSRIYKYKVLLGALTLAGMYALIMFELIDRTVAAIWGSFMALAMLAIINERPTLGVIISWIEYNTLALLFGMMLIVGIFSTTGFFEWIALKSYEVSKGRIWRLVVILCIFTAISSSLLDNVTSMLLLTPVVVRLCKVIDISPIPVIISIVTISNIGGCATAVGDPPMAIIVNTREIIDAGIDFAEVFFVCAPGTVVIAIVALFYYKWYFKEAFSSESTPTPAASLQLQKEIDIWRDTEKRLNHNVPEERKVKEMLQDFMFQLQTKLDEDKIVRDGPPDMANLTELKKEYRIHDRTLFIYSSCVLSVVVLMFFLENFIGSWVHLPLPWIAVLGALTLMVLADIHDMEVILHKVEWSTLIFFAALFVLMEGLDRLGLVGLIGDYIAELISHVDSDIRLFVAVCVIVWVSAIVSAIIDSIPYTTAMIPIIIQLANDPALDLPLRPLVYALAFGTGLGGNGTLIGSSANLVCAGLAEQNGFPISFMQFMKVGMPLMFISVFIANIYLVLVFIAFGFGKD